MNIGIIGYGKMGKDIFTLLFDKLPDADFTVLVRSDSEKHTAAVIKTLDKALKRKKLTEEQYNFKKGSFRFTGDIAALSGCDTVIECIYEDMGAKKALFAQLADTVSEKCLLLSNTSSLNLEEVFADVKNISGCLGLHFFYPVKLTGFAELNVLSETSQEAIEKTGALVKAVGKKPIVFRGEYHIYLNQLISCMVDHALLMKKHYNVSAKELNSALGGIFPTAAPFDILDSIGLKLMGGEVMDFSVKRCRSLFDFGYEQMKSYTDAGCPQGSLEFLDWAAENESDTGNSCADAEPDMLACLLNETVNALDEYGGESGILLEAVTDTLGLADSLKDCYSRYGAEKIFAVLDKYAEETGFPVYKHKDITVWDKYFG